MRPQDNLFLPLPPFKHLSLVVSQAESNEDVHLLLLEHVQVGKQLALDCQQGTIEFENYKITWKVLSRYFKWHHLIKFYTISIQLLPKLKWKVRNGNHWWHGCNYNISNNCCWWNALQFLSRRRGRMNHFMTLLYEVYSYN